MKEGAFPARKHARTSRAEASGSTLLRRISGVPALLLAAFAVAALYDAYRYPLRINDASTSSTYRNTPLALQAGKYVVLAAIAVALVAYAARNRHEFSRPRPRDIVLSVFGAYALARATIAGLLTHSVSSLHVVLPFVCGVPFAVAVSCWTAAAPGRAERFLRAAMLAGAWLVVAHALVDAAEYIAWLATGRLPALAEPHRLVRFGGIWDDPNGCAAFSALVATGVLGGALATTRRLSAIVLGASLLVLALAWSLSGWLVLAVGVLGVGIPRFGWRRVVAVFVPLAAVVALVLALAAAVGTSMGGALSAKLGSASQRLHLAHHVARAHSALGWLVGVSRPQHVEDAFGAWLGATGAIGLALFVAWLSTALGLLSGTRDRWLLVAACGFVLASLFVPLFVVFPVGFFVLLALSGAPAVPDRQGVGVASTSPARIDAS